MFKFVYKPDDGRRSDYCANGIMGIIVKSDKEYQDRIETGWVDHAYEVTHEVDKNGITPGNTLTANSDTTTKESTKKDILIGMAASRGIKVDHRYSENKIKELITQYDENQGA